MPSLIELREALFHYTTARIGTVYQVPNDEPLRYWVVSGVCAYEIDKWNDDNIDRNIVVALEQQVNDRPWRAVARFSLASLFRAGRRVENDATVKAATSLVRESVIDLCKQAGTKWWSRKKPYAQNAADALHLYANAVENARAVIGGTKIEIVLPKGSQFCLQAYQAGEDFPLSRGEPTPEVTLPVALSMYEYRDCGSYIRVGGALRPVEKG